MAHVRADELWLPSHSDGSDQADRVEGGPPVEQLPGARHLHGLHPQPHLILHVDLPLQLPPAQRPGQRDASVQRIGAVGTSGPSDGCGTYTGWVSRPVYRVVRLHGDLKN